MRLKEVDGLIKSFRWNLLSRLYGWAHSSIIGFIATEQISLSEYNTILDGAPSPVIGAKRQGQKYADLILCKRNQPFIVVEVETLVSNDKRYIIQVCEELINGR